MNGDTDDRALSSEDSAVEDEQVYRASAHALLAALLRATPRRELLEQVSGLSPHGDELDALGEAMAVLAAAAKNADPDAIEDEYNALFIGLGKGEIVPYASWYLTGFLMEQPLSDLRDDLRAMGFERSEETREPEDHAGAIFEIFSVMITDRRSLAEQRSFFDKHMKPWLARFFNDLGEAGSAEFYKPVALFGAAFIELEQAYLSMRS